MCCVFSTESTVFTCFHSVRMSFLILCHVVVTLFAFCTCQCDSNAHNFHLAFFFFSTTAATLSNFRHKKKAFASSIRLHIITHAFMGVKTFLLIFLLFITIYGNSAFPSISTGKKHQIEITVSHFINCRWHQNIFDCHFV